MAHGMHLWHGTILLVKPLGTSKYEAFRAIARMQRARPQAKVQPRVTRALMDPAAELNLVWAELLEPSGAGIIKMHARENANVLLSNNSKQLGSIKKAVYLSFALNS